MSVLFLVLAICLTFRVVCLFVCYVFFISCSLSKTIKCRKLHSQRVADVVVTATVAVNNSLTNEQKQQQFNAIEWKSDREREKAKSKWKKIILLNKMVEWSYNQSKMMMPRVCAQNNSWIAWSTRPNQRKSNEQHSKSYIDKTILKYTIVLFLFHIFWAVAMSLHVYRSVCNNLAVAIQQIVTFIFQN